jgi:sulfatase maturation enzyme AslB (radical SAM superfamily)
MEKYKYNLSFSISIDGNKELHDSCRVQKDGSGSYDIAIAGVEHFRQHYNGKMGSKMTMAPSNITYVFDAVKNYHKYIDKSKVPEKPGSDKVNISIPSSSRDSEANISKTGDTGLTVKDGKIYFGDIDDQITKVDSSIVNCATNGTSLGEFLNAALRNSKQ